MLLVSCYFICLSYPSMILLIAADSTSAFPSRCFIFISIIILCVVYRGLTSWNILQISEWHTNSLCYLSLAPALHYTLTHLFRFMASRIREPHVYAYPVTLDTTFIKKIKFPLYGIWKPILYAILIWSYRGKFINLTS